MWSCFTFCTLRIFITLYLLHLIRGSWKFWPRLILDTFWILILVVLGLLLRLFWASYFSRARKLRSWKAFNAFRIIILFTSYLLSILWSWKLRFLKAFSTFRVFFYAFCLFARLHLNSKMRAWNLGFCFAFYTFMLLVLIALNYLIGLLRASKFSRSWKLWSSFTFCTFHLLPLIIRRPWELRLSNTLCTFRIIFFRLAPNLLVSQLRTSKLFWKIWLCLIKLTSRRLCLIKFSPSISFCWIRGLRAIEWFSQRVMMLNMLLWNRSRKISL